MNEDERELNRRWRIREDERHRAAICEWLAANGIKPRDVPIDGDARIADGALTIEVFVRDEDGRIQLNPHCPDTVMRQVVTVPVVVPPTPAVELWLTDTCPTCGR